MKLNPSILKVYTLSWRTQYITYRFNYLRFMCLLSGCVFAMEFETQIKFARKKSCFPRAYAFQCIFTYCKFLDNLNLTLVNLVIKFAEGGLSVVPDLLLPGVLPGFLGLSDLGVSQLAFILAGVAFGVTPTGGVEGVPTIDLLG